MTRVHVTIASAELERNPPLPAGTPRGAAGIWSHRANLLRRDRNSPIIGQPLSPVFIRSAERCAEQKRSKAKAVDEQVSGYPPSVRMRNRLDEPVLTAQR